MASRLAIAPGKLILSGEHAAVYGRPALVMAVNHQVMANVTTATDGVFRFLVPDLGRDLKLTADELTAVCHRLQGRYEQFLAGDLTIAQVMPKAVEMIPFAYWQAAGDALPAAGVDVRVIIELPLGAGMGSSAAVALAIAAAAAAALGRNWGADDLFAAAMACERLRHGRPSGIDPYTCLHGGFVHFRDGRFTHLDLPAPKFAVVHTGSPKCSTGDCVEEVGEQFGADSALWDAFAEVTGAVQAAVTANDTAALREAVRANHRLLDRIGVVPGRVADFIAEVEAAGGAAKICGAGAVRGQEAGLVMVLADESPNRLARQYGYTDLEIEGDAHGCRVLDGDGAR